MRKFEWLGAAALMVVVGCASTDQQQGDIPQDALTRGEAFVPIAKQGAPAIGALRSSGAVSNSILNPVNGSDFYLAIHKQELEKEWFLTGYLKQYYPLDVDLGAASSMGTRVVSFRVQNGKVFLFDVAKNKQTSGEFNNADIIVDAYPIVKGYAPFDGLPNAHEYVLFDPSAGENKFALGADNFYDFYLSSAWATTFRVGVSFMQNFAKLEDGVSYQQVFSGQGEIPGENGAPFTYRASGTLSVALRRYAEGEGYKPTPAPWQSHYFLSDYKLVPGSGGGATATAVHWNIKPGMKPIEFIITRDILALAEEHQGADVLGAVRKGVENWNDVFGFTAFQARLAEPGEDFARDDVNAIVVDNNYRGYAFANWRTNPNTGEIRGATVYLPADFFVGEDYFKEEPTDPENLTAQDKPEVPARSFRLAWEPLKTDSICKYAAPKYRKERRALRVAEAGGEAAAPELTSAQKFEAFLTHVVLHEVGHTLGLRHNFLGSLANNSVMDYLDDEDSVARATPGAYDVEAIKYLYQTATRAPQAPFCTDGDYNFNPDCAPFDYGADPLKEKWAPVYQVLLEIVTEWGWGSFFDMFVDYYMNGVLGWARAAEDPAVAVEAYNLAMGAAKAPISAENLAIPGYAQMADGLALRVLRRLYLDPAEARGYIADDPLHAEVVALTMVDLRANLTNVDKVRSFETRRVMVDILKKMQNDEAYAILTESKAAINAALSLGGMSAQEVRDTNDLLARINRAISPYYE
jgi:hypothetical protein